MIIKRVIKGDEIEVELTSEELFYAYLEQIEKDIYKDICKIYLFPSNKIDEAIDRIEDTVGRNRNFWNCYWSAVQSVCEDMGFKMKNANLEED